MEQTRTTYERADGTVEVERIFTGTKTIEDLLWELVCRQSGATGPRPVGTHMQGAHGKTQAERPALRRD